MGTKSDIRKKNGLIKQYVRWILQVLCLYLVLVFLRNILAIYIDIDILVLAIELNKYVKEAFF